jgi:hypothetical protein
MMIRIIFMIIIMIRMIKRKTIKNANTEQIQIYLCNFLITDRVNTNISVIYVAQYKLVCFFFL